MLGTSNRTLGKTKVILFEDDDGDAIAVPRAFSTGKNTKPLLRLKNGSESLTFPKGETERKSPRIDVTLRDIDIPKVTGIELLVAQRNDPTLRRTVLFALMTSGDEGDTSAAYFANGESCIFKPHSKGTLLKLVPTMIKYRKFSKYPIIRKREHLNG